MTDGRALTRSGAEADSRHHWQECAAEWLERKRARSGSERTAAIYERTLMSFFSFCRLHPAEVLPTHVLQFAVAPSLKDGRPVTAATSNHRIAVVSSFYAHAGRFLVATPQGHRPLSGFNPADNVDRTKVQAYKTSRAGDASTIRGQIAAIPGDVAGLRDRALILCYAMTGRRLQEIAGMAWGDIDTTGKRAVLHIARVKGGEAARIALPADAWAAIQAYVRVSGRAPLGPTLPVFVALRGDGRRPLSAQSVWTIIRSRLGLHPHQLRHTFAHEMVKAGADVREVQAMLGHKSVATTELYIGRLEATVNPHEDKLADVFLGKRRRRPE